MQYFLDGLAWGSGLAIGFTVCFLAAVICRDWLERLVPPLEVGKSQRLMNEAALKLRAEETELLRVMTQHLELIGDELRHVAHACTAIKGKPR